MARSCCVELDEPLWLVAAPIALLAALYAWLLFAGPAERDLEMQRRSQGRG